MLEMHQKVWKYVNKNLSKVTLYSEENNPGDSSVVE